MKRPKASVELPGDPVTGADLGSVDESELPTTFVDYETQPREYFLNAVTTVLDVQTRVSDLYSHPFDQIQEQLRLLIEKVKERQEGELINNAEYGLIANTAPVAFGAMGIPIIVGGQVTGIDPFKIGQMAGRQLPLLSVIVPLYGVAVGLNATRK